MNERIIIIDVKLTEINEVYYCEICGNKVKVLESGFGQLVCCGQPMMKIKE